MTTKAKTTPRTLADFARDKRVSERMANCPVCKLPKEVREELARCRTLKIPGAWILEWLEGEHGVTVTPAELSAHRTGYHDQRNEAA